ncbi:MAG: hypothetical protein KKD77_21080 [Gammaproteobacteria bacterium]|nr:hypothetical protein [Gammaproteobacteria bacterium]
MNKYQTGDKVRISASFTDSASALTDPTVVLFQGASPLGTASTLTYLTDAALVKDSTGIYHVDISVTASGIWPYRFYATGSGQSAMEGAFAVARTEFSGR